jgi:PAS domain S-box-containing protein
MVLGYTQEEFQTMNFPQIHPKEELEKVSYAFRKIMEGDLNSLNDTKVMRKDGRLIPVDITGNSIEFFGRKLIQGIFRDITERKRAEEALRLAEEKYRAIVENAVEGIFQSTSDGKFLMVNTAVAKFYGYDSPEELITAISNIGEQLYVYPEDRQRYRRLLADEGVVKGFENQFYRKDGTIKWGSMNVRSVKDKEGHILHYEGTIEDITARKEAEEGLQNSLDKLRKAMGGIIQAMALTVETRDPYTAGHQRRVADLARAIAQEMGLPEDQVDALRMAGNVHDLGKISIPAEILSKPAQLSDIEFSLIKAHPQISYDILKDINFNWPVAQIVLQHHERINGSGYPNGLSGKAIYLEARILAVADVVEAISSHRPYRPAFGIDVALEEISKNKDVLYDPEAVEACLRLFREKGFKFE